MIDQWGRSVDHSGRPHSSLPDGVIPLALKKVRASEAMPPEDFTQHINLRHAQAGEIAGLRWVSVRAGTRDRAVWEAYHRRLHDIKEYQHEH